MGCCQCIGIEQEFNDKYVQRQLKKFHRQGLNKTTRLLIQALIDRNITGASVLDIGGGFGGIGLRLLNSGVSQYTLVEASPAYATAARQELTSKFSPQLFTVNQGDFVTLSPETMEHDIVTLDRVICCYDDVELLVNTSCQKAKQFYGVVFPIDSAI
ncbi:MAG: methyltransferase domain-containing protein, partial [Calditrichaeota bacterium]